MELPTCILLDPNTAKCRDIFVSADNDSIRLLMEAIQNASACPKCSQQSNRVHSRYQRKLADLPWACVPVKIEIEVRRFFCDNSECTVDIFTERLPTIAAPWARRTQRLSRTQQQIGLMSGGSVGARLCEELGCSAGVDLLLGLVRCVRLPESPVPRVLGVDDWAKRKGHSYGTILVDHERECVVDILADRTPETLAQWLRDHPGVEIVTRDRAEAYAQGIREGAPDAIQVADRWHLLKNLTDAMVKVLQDHSQLIRSQIEKVTPPTEGSISAETTKPDTTVADAPTEHIAPPVSVEPSIQPTPANQLRQKRAEEAHALHEKGWSIKAIALQLKCAPKTISRYLQRQMPLPPRQTRLTTKLDAYRGHIIERWNEGCHNAAQLLREIQSKGFDGRRTTLRKFVAELRQMSDLPARSRQPGGILIQPERANRVPSYRQIAWMSTRPSNALGEAQRSILTRVAQISPALKTALDTAQSFAVMVCQRQPEKFDAWLETATASGLASLKSFASGLRDDYAAVKAALSLCWSNGRTEGNVNRLKCMKRQMYGRAKLDLLRLRLMAT